MKTLHVRLSDDEDAILQEKAACLNCSVSEVVRDLLFKDAERISGLRVATAAQVEALESRLNSLADALQKVAVLPDLLAALEQSLAPISELASGQVLLAERLEIAEREIVSLSENMVRLVEIETEERRAPFGMDRAFFQSATMAGFTLARGTFSSNPEAWEPYKEEARRRAFKSDGG